MFTGPHAGAAVQERLAQRAKDHPGPKLGTSPRAFPTMSWPAICP
jgi:hypothetical protein